MSDAGPKLKTDWDKLLNVVSFLIGDAQRTGTAATQYQIVKTIFVADQRHLNDYGRPVVFCNYVAMENGPVPSEAFDMLKPEFDWRKLKMKSAPWKRIPAPHISKNAFQFKDLTRPVDLRSLSETDVEYLHEALATVRSLGFGGVKDFTHRHRAYKDAWREGSERKSFPMKYKLLIEDEDEELLSDLVHASRHTA
jgi:hypothetical protein